MEIWLIWSSQAARQWTWKKYYDFDYESKFIIIIMINWLWSLAARQYGQTNFGNARILEPYGQPNSGNASILGAYGPPTHPLVYEYEYLVFEY